MLLERIKGIIKDKSLVELKAQFEEYKRVCENVKPHRNKRIGHSDIKRAEDSTFQWLPTVTLEEVDNALGVLRKMMRDLLLALCDRDYDYDPDLALGCDGNHLLYLLRKAHGLQLNTAVTEGVV